MKKKMTGITTVLICAALLCACHQNPLKKVDDQKAVNLLLKASQSAEAKANTDLRGLGYALCLSGRKTPLDCNAFFVDMVEFAKNDLLFKGLTVGDLKDSNVFAPLKSLYEQTRFNSL